MSEEPWTMRPHPTTAETLIRLETIEEAASYVWQCGARKHRGRNGKWGGSNPLVCAHKQALRLLVCAEEMRRSGQYTAEETNELYKSALGIINWARARAKEEPEEPEPSVQSCGCG
jgi:hypothetical protein